MSNLDGMRGMAALLVFCLHAQPFLGLHLFDHGYLMVDLFFLMSGFVLAATYGAPLDAGRGGLWFARRRAARLYPLALLGLLLGAAVSLGLVSAGLAHPPSTPFALTFALGALFLPWLGGGLVAPLNGPLWSLQAEVWTNAVYGFVARRLTTSRLLLLLGLTGSLLVAAALNAGTLEAGASNNDPARQAGTFAFATAWVRIGFSFPLGLLLHRLWSEGRLQLGLRLSPALVMPLVLIAVALPRAGTTALFDLAVVMLVFPALLIFAVSTSRPDTAATAAMRGDSQPVFAWMGRLSFPFYVLHGPVVVALRSLSGVGHTWPLFFLALSSALTLSLLAERFVDAPLRRIAGRLGDHAKRRPAAPPLGALG